MIWDRRSHAPSLDSPEVHTYTFFMVGSLERIAATCQKILEQLGAYEEPSVIARGSITGSQSAYIVYKFDSPKANFEGTDIVRYSRRDRGLGDISDLDAWCERRIYEGGKQNARS